MAGEPTFSPSVNPSYPFETRYKPNVLSTEYGDGYIERAGDGLNAVHQHTLSVTWENITYAEAVAIHTFFFARKGYEAFLWTPPGLSEAKYICMEWDFTLTDADNYELVAEMKRVFDN